MLFGCPARVLAGQPGFILIGRGGRLVGLKYVNIGSYSIGFGVLLRKLLNMLLRLGLESSLSGLGAVLIGSSLWS